MPDQTTPSTHRHHIDLHALEHSAWAVVAHNPLHSMWDLQGSSLKDISKRVWKGLDDDNLLGRASQLAYAFFSAIFPALIALSSLLGIIAKSSTSLYVELLHKIGALIPPDAFRLVLQTFQATTAASSGGKVLLGVAVALFSASVGVAAIQDTLNTVYRVRETRPFWKARLEAMGVTLLVSLIVFLAVFMLFATDFSANWLMHHITFTGGFAISVLARIVGWLIASLLMILAFEMLYYFCPDVPHRKWRGFTPGGVIGLVGWVAGSLGLRVYLHYFNTYAATYGALGAVIILLLWFYVTGLMILLGGEVNSQIERAVAEHCLITGTATAPTEAEKAKVDPDCLQNSAPPEAAASAASASASTPQS